MTPYSAALLVITGVGLAGCLFFCVAYWLRSGGAWWRTEAGRFLMTVYANLAALFALVIANQVFGQWPGRQAVTLTVFCAYVVETWWPARLLWHAQARAERDKPSPPNGSAAVTRSGTSGTTPA